ncbi:MAG: hypothetical protein IPJ14_16330 [Kineosporiaceae bacterium]|nr:hypothetical protein [Kineosporiaceae bacterium]MBK7624177.1 hypothetical protein [Kineosporiaceae bacterium]MBK8075349.1 hypothetical protein [Kineosporiaceae bacterium]
MTSQIPVAHRVLRRSWSVLHLVTIVLAFLLLVSWYVTDGNGSRLVQGWWDWSWFLQWKVFHVVDFPWA